MYDDRKIKIAIGKRISSLRGFYGVSQRKLAAELGMSPAALCNWERGVHYPDPASLRKLCRFFGCSADYILVLTDEFSAKSNSLEDTVRMS